MKRTYSQIDMDERRKIARWRMAGISIVRFAAKLGRHRSTIFREVKRNTFFDPQTPELNGYYCVTAHEIARERRAKLRKFARFAHVRQSVIERIMDDWSSQQIAVRMQLERHPLSVSHETIYKFAYSADEMQSSCGGICRSAAPGVGRGMRDDDMDAASARKSTFSTVPMPWPSASSSAIGNAISSSFARSSARLMSRHWSNGSVALPCSCATTTGNRDRSWTG